MMGIKLRTRHGFTLVEMAVVLVVLGLLMTGLLGGVSVQMENRSFTIGLCLLDMFSLLSLLTCESGKIQFLIGTISMVTGNTGHNDNL